MAVRFSNQMIPNLIQPFWAAWQGGEFLTDAAALAGTSRHRGLAWLREAGGVRPRRGLDLQGRYLSFAEREELALGRAAGESIRSIAEWLGRSPSTISRSSPATLTHGVAIEPPRPAPWPMDAGSLVPKPAKLATNLALRACVEHDLAKKYSANAGRLREDHPDNPEMWVSTETIYQSLYVQSRGALRRDLAVCLRTGRALRQPNRQGAQRRTECCPT
jgi:IS30 family transposase